jgi:hypothetical protein
MLNLHKRAQRAFSGLFLGSVSTSQLFSTVHLILTVEMIRAANKYHPTLPSAPATLAVSLILQSTLILPQAATSSSTPPSRSPFYPCPHCHPKTHTCPHLTSPLLPPSRWSHRRRGCGTRLASRRVLVHGQAASWLRRECGARLGSQQRKTRQRGARTATSSAWG